MTAIRIHSGSRPRQAVSCCRILKIGMPNSPKNDADDIGASAVLERDRLKLHRNLKFVKKIDELDTATHMVLESWLNVSLNNEASMMTAEDLDDMRVQLLALDNIRLTGYFKRIAYPLRLLRQCIFLYDARTLPENFPSVFKIDHR